MNLEEGTKKAETSLSDKVIYIIERGWVIPVYRVIYSLLSGLIGVYIALNGFNAWAAIFIVFYLIIFGVVEFLLGKSIDSIKENTRQVTLSSAKTTFQKYEEEQKELEFKLSLFYKISLFLSGQLQRTIRTLNHLLSAASSGRMPQAEWVVKKKRIVENTLERMCTSFISTASKRSNLPEVDVMFRSTCMVLERGQNGHEYLVYYAWHTPGGHQPRSASLNICYRKGEGVAGISWQRERVVIEDAFKHGDEWKDNYDFQGELYGSMACIPVFTCTIDGKDNVIGIITIDTNIKGFFGHKNDKIMEDKISNWVRPYADYIAFTMVMAEIIKEEFTTD